MALKTLYATFEAERAEQQHQDLILERILGSDVRDAIMEAAEEEDTKETKRDKTGHKEEDSKEDSKKDAKDSEGKEESKDDEGSDEEALFLIILAFLYPKLLNQNHFFQLT